MQVQIVLWVKIALQSWTLFSISDWIILWIAKKKSGSFTQNAKLIKVYFEISW